MRLIDADELIDKNAYDLDNNFVVDLCDIREAPTVDAVPISVIEDIKAEIRQKQWHLEVDSANQVVGIIDKFMESVSK